MRRTVVLLALIIASSVASFPTTAVRAEVTPITTFRDVATFATISSATVGPPLFESHGASSVEIGRFEESVQSEVIEGESQASATATQTSEITPSSVIAIGNFLGAAQVAGDTPFAEGQGASRVTYAFSMDTPTPLTLSGFIAATGHGVAGITLNDVVTLSLLIDYHTNDGDDEIFESFLLPPGSYEFTAHTSGYGQAMPGEVVPSSGDFSVNLNLDTTTSAGDLGVNAVKFTIFPNPVRGAARIEFYDPAISGEEAYLLDSTGRLIRRLGRIDSGWIDWNTQDDRGEPVPSGVYFVRVGRKTGGRLTVLR